MVVRRSARISTDPDRYIRNVKGGKFQARPYDEGKRYDLGIFPTKSQARLAIQLFWRGLLAPKPRFVRAIYLNYEKHYQAVVSIPYASGLKIKKVRSLPGLFKTPMEAQRVAIEFLDRTIGAAARAELMVRG